MLEWADDLKLCGTELYLDSRQPRARCFVSHAHSDHLGTHEQAIATGPTRALAEYRIGLRGVTELIYCDDYSYCPHTRVRLLPAGATLLPRARAILAEVAGAARAARRAGSDPPE